MVKRENDKTKRPQRSPYWWCCRSRNPCPLHDPPWRKKCDMFRMKNRDLTKHTVPYVTINKKYGILMYFEWILMKLDEFWIFTIHAYSCLDLLQSMGPRRRNGPYIQKPKTSRVKHQGVILVDSEDMGWRSHSRESSAPSSTSKLTSRPWQSCTVATWCIKLKVARKMYWLLLNVVIPKHICSICIFKIMFCHGCWKIKPISPFPIWGTCSSRHVRHSRRPFPSNRRLRATRRCRSLTATGHATCVK